MAAAASLTAVVDEALRRWNGREAAQGAATYASSSTLSRQIEQGAPFDLFLSANSRWMDELELDGLVESASREVFATNRLVLVCPIDAEFTPVTFEVGGRIPRRMSDDRWAVGDPDHVPVGIHAQQALTELRWWPHVQGGMVRASDARAALRLVELGEVEWGIVYATDAAASRKVRVVEWLPEVLHDPITYPGALMAEGAPGARAFLEWWRGPEGREILEQAGFGVPDSSTP